MEFKLCIEDTHSRPVLAVAINPNRREIYTGSEGQFAANSKRITLLIIRCHN